MDTKIFWDVFRDTGDPLCWLLTRTDKPKDRNKTEQTNDSAPKRRPS